MDPLLLLFFAGLASFILQFFDGSLGMGYGSLTPLLILLGFPPLESVIAVIVCSFLLSLVTGILHHHAGNVDFSCDSKSLHIVVVLTGFGLLGVITGSFLAIEIPDVLLKSYIAVLVLIIGLLVLLSPKRKSVFSWVKISLLGVFASFNKALSGSGYGPVLAGGQIISGVKSKKAVSITALSESLTSVFSLLTFILLGQWQHFSAPLIFSMLVGGLLSTPLAILFVKKSDPSKLRILVAVMSISVGILTLLHIMYVDMA